MLRRMNSKLTYANVVASLALFVALGGSSYAATQLARNSVGAAQIRANAVGASELAPGAVPTFTGVVDRLGNKIRGSAVSVEVKETNFVVKFPRNVDACVATATIGSGQKMPYHEYPPAGRITVMQINGDVVVATYDVNGAPVPLPFNIVVVC